MKVTAEDLVKLIRQRYPLDRPNGFQTHVVLEQVPDGTGMHQGHWIDVAVFDLWPSKGLLRSAFEIKVSRSDFIRELQHPSKHKWVLECFHEFWFVAPKDVIQLDELPVNVGWMCPRGNKLVVKRHAVQNPNPKLDDVLLAAFMRAAAKEIARVNSTTAKDILQNSEEHQLAKLYQEAVTTFIHERGVRKYEQAKNTEDILGWLGDATMDNQLKDDRNHLLEIAARFQREIVSLLNIFLIIANKGLFARDQLGKYIVSAYGGEDSESLQTLKACAKGARAMDSQKRYAQTIELILNWDKEFPGHD
jgi:hypothetical protein